MFGFNKPLDIPEPSDCLPGRSESMPVPDAHYVSGNPIQPPFPESYETAVFGLGCFWGAERRFWETEGVFSTAVGYLGGHTPNPTYEEVCTGRTGHNEVVLVVYDPAVIDYAGLLKVFWEAHNPTQGMRQGNDVGTQYRSGIYTYSDQQEQLAQESKDQYSKTLLSNGYSQVTTEIKPAGEFYYAEPYHQQYLAKNPGGYCGLGGTGVCYTSE